MTKYIELKEAEKAFRETFKNLSDMGNAQAFINILRHDVPAADVKPVVLCKDCEYCRRVDEFEYWCYGFYSPARLVRKDDFCSHGKAKE